MEHFGVYSPIVSRKKQKRIWIHAVSVGELQSIAQLVQLLSKNRNIFLIISTTSTTGRQVAEKLYDAYAKIIYFPIDFWPFVRSAWKCIRPDLILSVDSELWPEHFQRARRAGVPVGIINGRLSKRSFHRYCRMPAIARWLWRYISFVFACDADSARRIGKFLSPPAKIIAVGNLKCGRQPHLPLEKFERASLLHSLGLPDFGPNGKATRILFGCSTWPDEEDLLLQALSKIRAMDPNWHLVLVPRHAERRGEIVALCRCAKFSFCLRSLGEPQAYCHDVAIVDTTGELSELIRIGTIAFLGKTLPPNAGAQSPLDAVAAKVPLVSGPSYDNFHEIMNSLHRDGAVEICPDADAVKATLLRLASDEVTSLGMSAGMMRYLLATGKTAQIIYKHVGNMLKSQ
ncbi:MAG: hypothetical protein LBI34_02505 [Puniceicoccales bacterium]|jgi:3-deoxy-D-manno-octulosonic-acid transferase|nr:hypothetical protein [Puniceicoccales bacterium]